MRMAMLWAQYVLELGQNKVRWNCGLRVKTPGISASTGSEKLRNGVRQEGTGGLRGHLPNSRSMIPLNFSREHVGSFPIFERCTSPPFTISVSLMSNVYLSLYLLTVCVLLINMHTPQGLRVSSIASREHVISCFISATCGLSNVIKCAFVRLLFCSDFRSY